MKVEKISRKLIKPLTPTPQNLKNYSISFIDKFVGPLNFAVVLFYESKPPENETQLEESLAKILVQFYPLAGRYIKNDEVVDCGDQGVEFVEAEAPDIELIDLVAKIETEQLNSLLPDQYFRLDEAATDPVMSIQATRFPSGGLAIAISVSHRIIDTSSLGTFVAAWSNATNPDKSLSRLDSFTPIRFDLPRLLPNRDHVFTICRKKQSNDVDVKIVVKRVLFNNEYLTSLRSKMRPNSDGETTVSRVRVACAVIAKALIGLDRAKLGVSRDFVITQPINMRERTIAPQPKNSCGNLWITSLTRRVAASEAKEIGMQELVDLISDCVGKSIADYAEILSPDRDGRDVIVNGFKNFNREVYDSETNAMFFTDWSKFGFYEADFGWGKPVWTSIGPLRPNFNVTVLMSDKEGDGIEAWVHLKKKDVCYFEQDEEIKLLTYDRV